MTVVVCSHLDCLNHGSEVCTANRVDWCKGQCSGYINSRDAMRVDNAPAVERKCGVITQNKIRPIR